MPALRNNQWEEVCRLYVLEGLTKVECYRRVYPKHKNMSTNAQYVRAHEVFKREVVQERIAELVELKSEMADREFQADAKYILKRLVDIDRMDILDIFGDDGSLLPVKEWPKVWRQFVSQFDVEEIFAGRGDERLQVGLLKKIKWPDKVRNLELIGKHVDVNAFKEVKELQGPGGGPVRMVTTEMTPQEAAEAYADTLNNE